MAKRGDYCGIVERHSSVYLRGPSASKHETWTIGRVGSATRSGVIKTAWVKRYGTELCLRADMQPRFWQPYTVSADRQGRASQLFDGREYPSADALREAF